MAQDRKSQPNWLLIETFGGGKGPSVISVGNRPVAFIPLEKLMQRSSSIAEVRRAIAGCLNVRGPWVETTDDRHIEAHPLFLGEELHGIWFWSQPRSVPVPPHSETGAWLIDLTSLTALGSPEWASMADIPKEFWGQERSVAAMFDQVGTTDRNEDTALAKIETEKAGQEHQGQWLVSRQDKTQWKAHFSLRIREIRRGPDNAVHRCSVGMSQNLGDVEATTTEATPSLAVLEHRYLTAMTDPGEFHALVSMKKVKLIRWITAAPPVIAWQGVASESEPAIHPEDLPNVLAAMKVLHQQRGEGVVRVKTVDGKWLPVPMRADPVMLDSTTTAAFVRVFLPEQAAR